MRYIENKIEVSKGVAFFILLTCLILANLIPGFSFLFLVSIIPAVYLGIGLKPAYNAMALIVLAALTYFLFGLDKTVYSFLIYILPSSIAGIMYGYGLFITPNFEIKHLVVKKENEYLTYASIKLFMISIMIFMLGAVGYFVFAKTILDVNVLGHMKDMVKTAAMNYTEMASKYNVSNKQTQSVIDTIISNSGAIVLTVYFVKSVIVALISYFIAIPVSGKFSGKRILYNGIDMVYLPGKPAIIYVVCIFLSILVEDVNIPFITSEMINTFVSVLSVLFFIEGVSIIVYLIRRWKTLKSVSNWAIMLVLFIFMGIFLGVVALGVMDNVFNYRLRWNNELITGGRDEQ